MEPVKTTYDLMEVLEWAHLYRTNRTARIEAEADINHAIKFKMYVEEAPKEG